MIELALDDFNTVIKPVVKMLNLKVSSFNSNIEGVQYGACSFQINSNAVICRSAKLTPKKQGLFIAIWKRDKNKIAVPYDINDHFELMIINVKMDEKVGQFVFPKKVLYQHRIISGRESRGKNGIRVYPSWERKLNKSATITQAWQREYFLEVSGDGEIDVELGQRLYKA